ncbi:MAG: hypothetical protein WC517_04085 [Patescibacteria group bacterium]
MKNSKSVSKSKKKTDRKNPSRKSESKSQKSSTKKRKKKNPDSSQGHGFSYNIGSFDEFGYVSIDSFWNNF